MIGFPISLIILLRRNRQNFDKDSFRDRYWVLTQSFKEDYYYWELVEMLQKIIIVMISEFILSGASYVLRIFSFSMSVYIFFMVTTLVQPYRSLVANRVNFMWTLQIILFLFSDSMVFSSSTASDNLKTYLGFYLAIVYALTFILTIVLISRRILFHWRNKKSRQNKHQNNDERIEIQARATTSLQ